MSHKPLSYFSSLLAMFRQPTLSQSILSPAGLIFLAFWFTHFITLNAAHALIGGLPSVDRGVIQIEIEPVSGKIFLCTASVIGLNPPLILTAAHCVRDAQKIKDYLASQVSIKGFSDSRFKAVKISSLSWRDTPSGKKYYEQEEIKKKGIKLVNEEWISYSETSVDIAIIEFAPGHPGFEKINSKDVFKIDLEGKFLSHDMPAKICGYGHQSFIRDLGKHGELTCGSAWIYQNQIFKEGMSERQSLALQEKFRSRELLASNLKALMGFLKRPEPHLVIFNSHIFDLTMVNGGDSGGPWFVTDIQNNDQKYIIGVTAASYADFKTKAIDSGAATWVSYKPIKEFLEKNIP